MNGDGNIERGDVHKRSEVPMKKTTAMPTDPCDECKQMKPAFGFVCDESR